MFFNLQQFFRSRSDIRRPLISGVDVDAERSERSIRCADVTADRTKLVFVSKGTDVKIFDSSGTVTHLGTSRILVDQIAVLNDGESVITVHTLSKQVQVWSISMKRRICSLFCGSFPVSVATIDHSRRKFVIGNVTGKLQVFLKTYYTASNRSHFDYTTTEAKHREQVTAIAVNRNFMASVSTDRTVKLWEIDTLQCLHTIKHGITSFQAIALSDNFLLLGHKHTAYYWNRMHVYELKGKTSHPKEIRSLRHIVRRPKFIREGNYIISRSTRGNKLLLHDTQKYGFISEVETSVRFDEYFLLQDGRIALITNTGQLSLFDPPLYFKPFLIQNSQTGSNSSRINSDILRQALKDVFEGRGTPVSKCNLINQENCKVCLQEWYAAHILLIMAFLDQELPHPRPYHWYEELYFWASTFDYTSKRDWEQVKSCLYIAERMQLIKSGESIVGAANMKSWFSREIEVINDWSKSAFLEIMKTQMKVDNLKKTFERYQKTQRYSQIISIAFSVIPMLSHVTTLATHEAFNLIEDIPFSEAAEYALGLSARLLIESPDHRGNSIRLESILQEYGISRMELHQMLITYRHKYQNLVGTSSSGFVSIWMNSFGALLTGEKARLLPGQFGSIANKTNGHVSRYTLLQGQTHTPERETKQKSTAEHPSVLALALKRLLVDSFFK